MRWMMLAVASVFCLVVARADGSEVVLFADDFDGGGSGSNWTTLSHGGDFTAEFAYDYSVRGIAAAPNSTGGTTVGMRLTVNSTDGVAALDAVNAYPIGLTLSGDQVLRFDMWLSYNGGAGGGAGSTQFALAGLMHSGSQVVWANNALSDGHWFGVTGEGGASQDYIGYRGGQLLSVDTSTLAAVSGNHTDVYFQTFFTAPPFETQGAPGKQWVEVEVSHVAGVIEWRINDRLMAIRYEPGASAGTILLGLMDTYTSIASPADDVFALFDNIRVVAPDCDQNSLSDSMEIAADPDLDCNNNKVLDACEQVGGSDFDNDGDVDLTDYESFADCLCGPALGPVDVAAACPALCVQAFAGGDGAVDLRDFAVFQRLLTRADIPPRPVGALTGTQFAADVAGLSRTTREARILSEVTGGNVPGFLRTFTPITVSALIGGITVQATYCVSSDYVAIGVDRDFVRMPMSPLIAQPIADAFDCILPTRKMVNDIYTNAATKLAPSPISPATTDITRMTTMLRHHRRVESQRGSNPITNLIGGIKKDVVITPQLASNPGRVAIYGWHQLNGVPIQPLYLGHVDFYADYSHGIRLVKSEMLVDGNLTTVQQVLADPSLHVLLSDEGVVPNPSY